MRPRLLTWTLTTCILIAGCSTFAPHGPKGVVMTPSVKDAGIHPTYAAVPYTSEPSTQVLDLYLPAAGETFPVVVYVHGGGFKFGDRRMVSAALVKGFLEAGYAVASIDYRLSGEATFPAAAQDMFKSIGFLKQHASSLHINPSQLAVFGESAGANLAALAGTAYQSPLFRSALLKDADLEPMAVIAQYPPVDFLRIDPMLAAQGCNSSMMHNAANSFESAYIGAPLASAAEKVAQSNPAHYASANSAPFFIQNGDADCNVGAGQSMLLVSALKHAGVPVSYELIHGAAHGGPAFETQDNIKKMVAFLQEAKSRHR